MPPSGEPQRPLFRLVPRGAERPSPVRSRLALGRGELGAEIVDGAVRSWLKQPDGQLVPLMWPASFRARCDPLGVIDDEGQLVASGGETVTVVGGYLPQGEPQGAGRRVFAAAAVASRSVPHPD